MKTAVCKISKNGVDYKFHMRPSTTDVQVIKEVIIRNQYSKKIKNGAEIIDFCVEPGDKWLDCGANIGTFSILASLRGAKVIAFEPEPTNYDLLVKNININKCKGVKTYQSALSVKNAIANLYLGSTDYQKYRHSLRPIRGRKAIEVKVKDIRPYLTKVNAVKMDIEGSEIEILETIDNWHNIRKLVFEYDFNQDPSVDRFKKVIRKLSEHFDVIHSPKITGKEYRHFPSGVLVFCYRQ
jgi:FkbM family methyltransferase